MTSLRWELVSSFSTGFGESDVVQVYPIRLDGSPSVSVRQGSHLIGYNYDTRSKSWSSSWNHSLFPSRRRKKDYPCVAENLLRRDNNLLIIQSAEGLNFYQPTTQNKEVQLLAQDGRFHEVSGVMPTFGKFYPDESLLGAFTRDKANITRFYAVQPDLVEEDDPYPLSNLQTEIPSEFGTAVKVFLTNLQHRPQLDFVLAAEDALKFYQFNEDYALEYIGDVPEITSEDATQGHAVFFADLTHQRLQDIVVLKLDGLYTFSLQNSSSRYQLVNHDSTFSQYYGWDPKFSSSIKLLDLDGDSRHDLIFTGAAGLTVLTFDAITNTWRYLVNPADIPIQQRYSIFQNAFNFPAISSKTAVFTSLSSELFFWEISSHNHSINETDAEQDKPVFSDAWDQVYKTELPVPASPNGTAPEPMRRLYFPEKADQLWTGDWDETFLTSATHPLSGRLGFKVPLLDTDFPTKLGVQVELNYESHGGRKSALGEGWDLNPGQEYISIDYQGNIFIENAKFHIFTHGKRWELELLEYQPSWMKFSLPNEPDIKIRFDRTLNQWETQSDSEVAVYGSKGENSAIFWNLSWDHWRGEGKDLNTLKRIPVAWFLVEQTCPKQKYSLHYSYIEDIQTIQGKAYTTALRLCTVSDGNTLNLTFDYGRKLDAEVPAKSAFNSQGHFVFPQPQDAQFYVQGYTLETESHKQKLKFLYRINEKKRFLTEIVQVIQGSDKNLLKFYYDSPDDTFMLSKVVTSRGIQLDFDFTTTVTPAEVLRAYPMMDEHCHSCVTFGAAYHILAYQTTLTNSIYLLVISTSSNQILAEVATPASTSGVESYTVHAFQAHFVVSVARENSHEVSIFGAEDASWSFTGSYTFGKYATVLFSEKHIAVSDGSQDITLLQNSNNGNEWIQMLLETDLPAISRVAMHENIIAAYSDSALWIFRNIGTTWLSKKVVNSDLADFDAQLQQTINQFSLDDETKDEFVRSFRITGLQVMQNLILLSTVRLSQGQIKCAGLVLVINSEFNVENWRMFDVSREFLKDIRYVYKHSESAYHLKYKTKGGKFEVELEDISGKRLETINQIRNRNERSDAKEKEIKDLNEKKKIGAKDLRKVILFDRKQLITFLGHTGLAIGNDTWYLQRGSTWEQTKFPTLVSLGESIKLEQQDPKRIILTDTDRQKVLNVNLNTVGHFVNRYPLYFAYQESPGTVAMHIFERGEEIGSKHIFENEILIMQSTFHQLVTMRNSTSSEHASPKELVFRPLTNFLPPFKEVLVAKETMRFGDHVRLKLYELTSHPNEIKLTVIPGSSKNVSGWREIQWSRPASGENMTKTETIFKASGTRVEMPPSQSNEAKNQDEGSTQSPLSDTKGMLWDESGNWLVSDFSPFDLSLDVAGYFGFESYEYNPSRWKFPEHKIQEGFTFTGRRFLRLDPGEKLYGEFLPQDQNSSYIGSCWVRSKSTLRLDDHVPIFRALLKTENATAEFIGLKSEVKKTEGSWSYLEIFLDFLTIKKIYWLYISENRNDTGPETELPRFAIALQVETRSEASIDVDHIRFAPKEHEFRALVFHPLTGQPTDVINGDATVSRVIYDKLHRKLVDVKSDGSIDRLSQECKACSPASKIILEPETGFHEDFDESSFQHRWKLGDPSAWRRAPGQLWHDGQGPHTISSSHTLVGSYAIKFAYYVSMIAELQCMLPHGMVTISRSGTSTTTVSSNGVSSNVPSSGEIVIASDHDRIWVWVDGALLHDQGRRTGTTGNSTLIFTSKGKTVVEDLIVLERPTLTIEYFNALHEKTQVIKLMDSATVLITETLYDALGRAAIETKPTIVHRSHNETMLQYYSNFAVGSKSDPQDEGSVWKTGKLQGLVHTLNPADGGYPFTRTQFEPTPLDIKRAFGRAGESYSVHGKYSQKFSRTCNVDFVKNLFPLKNGYRHEVVLAPNGSKKISVYDSKELLVALYVHVAGHEHILSTYEYDSKNRLVKTLPPMYHVQIKTESKSLPWKSMSRTSEELVWESIGAHLSYDSNGNLARKVSPDVGTVEYLYNSRSQLRFMITGTGNTTTVNFYQYDAADNLSETGYLKIPLGRQDLEAYVEAPRLPRGAKFYQQFYYVDSDPDLNLRGRLRRYITYNQEMPLVEELRFDSQFRMVAKRTLALPGISTGDLVTSIKRSFVAGQIHSLVYPTKFKGKTLRVIHGYDSLHRLKTLGVPGNPTLFLRLAHNGAAQVTEEIYQPGSKFQFARRYSYNSPGILVSISDPYLVQALSYEDGYAQKGFGDAIVMRSSFNASWTVSADQRLFRIPFDTVFDGSEYSTLCLEAMVSLGFVSETGKPLRTFPHNDLKMPLVCRGKVGAAIAGLVARKHIPELYGHMYAYGNHGELIKAKYFTSESQQDTPLTPSTFYKEIPDISEEMSQEIWKILQVNGYIISDCRNSDFMACTGKPGINSLVDDAKLVAVLKSVGEDHTRFASVISQFLITKVSENFSSDEFEELFLKWKGVNEHSPLLRKNTFKRMAVQLYAVLEKEGLTSNPQKLLNKKFTLLLRKFSQFLPQILQVLSSHFKSTIGQHPFDVESYDIDSNGNHRIFNVGTNALKLHYKPGTNQINTVEMQNLLESSSLKFPVKYDARGNIVMAKHLSIEKIQYDPTSQRTTKIEMVNGSWMEFFYDSQGERVLKRVFTSDGYVKSETHYVRDDTGKVLSDQRTIYFEKPVSTLVLSTSYIYGPRGLIGFIRNDKFFQVLTDHMGSTRLVVLDGEVIAAYDYLPYGQLMRSYGKHPDGQIQYRFTGQEYDEETGLYNFHARLYDPTTGRFLQPDPQAQYFSPYKYAGNSPNSFVDPDGEEAVSLTMFAVMGVAALVGAYAGGAAVNNRVWIGDWDFSDPGTYIGVVRGAIGGASLPGGVIGSVGVIGVIPTALLGAGGSYLIAAEANQCYNFLNWTWSRPGTWNAIFSGFGVGLDLVQGLNAVPSAAEKWFGIGTNGKVLFTTAGYLTAFGVGYTSAARTNDGNFAFWKWDFSNPGTVVALINGIESGTKYFVKGGKVIGGFGKLTNKLKTSSLIFSILPSTDTKAFISIMKNPDHRIYKIAGAAIAVHKFAGGANNDLEATRWDMASFATYEGILNGAFFGKDVRRMLSAILKKPASLATTPTKSGQNKWTTTFANVFNAIKGYMKEDGYSSLMKHLFNDPKLQSTLSVVLKSTDVQEFMSKGYKSYKDGESIPPDSLVKAVKREAINRARSTDASVWESQTFRSDDRNQKLFPDRDTSYLSSRTCSICGTKRGISLANEACDAIGKGSGLKPTPNVTAMTRFRDDPIQFMRNAPLTTSFTRGYGLYKNAFTSVHIPSWISELYPSIQATSDYSSPPLQTFSLYPVPESPGYAIILDNGSNEGIRARWLSTNETITVPARFLGETRMIFTSELRGCSIYTKFDPELDRIEIFHHHRRFNDMSEGNHSIVPTTDGTYHVYDQYRGETFEYTDVLSYEEYYSGHTPENPDPAVRVVANAVIYNVDGTWRFAVQLYEYLPKADIKSSSSSHLPIDGLKLVHFRTREIQGIPKHPIVALPDPLYLRPDSTLGYPERPTREAELSSRAHLGPAGDGQTAHVNRNRRSAVLDDPTTDYESSVMQPGKDSSNPSEWICRYGARSGEEKLDGITCHTPNSLLMVFQKSNEDAFPREDKYEYCKPITWNDHESVFCEGNSSTIVFTPLVSTRLFDGLNDQLLLLQVLPAIYRQLKQAWGFVHDSAFKRPEETLMISEDQQAAWKEQLETIKYSIEIAEENFGEQELRWARILHDELEDEVEDLTSRGHASINGMEDIGVLEERLEALVQDVAEMFMEEDGKLSGEWSELENVTSKAGAPRSLSQSGPSFLPYIYELAQLDFERNQSNSTIPSKSLLWK